MKRFIFFLISFYPILFAFGQEKNRTDSIPAIKSERIARMAIPEKLFIQDNLFPDEGFNMPIFDQPLLPDYNQNLDLKKYLRTPVNNNISINFTGNYFNPYLSTFQVFNQSTYQLNDRFTVGGYSFGASSVFDAPAMNPAIHKMSIQGASMFMQYKISDKFRVETRVSISNQKSPLAP